MPIEHEVEQGECILSIADAYGFLPETIWNDPANAELKAQRKDPSILFPGDIVVIPERRSKQATGGTEARHRFRRKGVPLKVAIQFLEDGEPISDEPYQVFPDIGTAVSGRTDADGAVAFPVSPRARSAIVRIGAGEESRDYRLRIGELDPIDEAAGVRERLHNLGYLRGPPDGTVDEETREAVEEFQTKQGVPDPNGRIDQPTRDKVREIYGS